MTSRRRRWPGPLVVAAATLAGLLLAEGIVRATDVDWRYARRRLHFIGRSPWLVPDPDPRVVYRQAPGRYEAWGGLVIDPHGNRATGADDGGPAPAVRIACAGGSNVFGMSVADGEAWPAQLGTELRRRTGRAVDVANLGVPGYVPCQTVRLLERELPRLDPDVLVLALSNRGPPCFPAGAPPDPWFARDPRLWLDYVSPEEAEVPRWLSPATKAGLIQHVRLYRFTLLALMEMRRRPENLAPEFRNIHMVQDLIVRERARRKVVVFLCPAVLDIRDELRPYTQGLDVPVFVLDARDKPPEYRDIHPPAPVLRWYAENLAAWLIDRGWVGPAPAR
jgi:hypothetical protein